MSNWKELPLNDVIELVIDHRGKTPKKLGFDDFFSEGYPVLSAKHVKTSGLVNLDAMRFANEEMYKKWMKEPTQKGDVILTSEAPLGELFYIDGSKKYVLGQRVFGLRPKSDVLDSMYLLVWLSSAEGQGRLQARATGSTVQGIKQSELLKIMIPIPPMEVQKDIASIYGSLDQKIQLNTQINQTLEQIAQALFKSWFVDFEPVRAKVQALSDGLSLEQAELAAMQAISGKTPEELTALSQTQPERYAELAETAKAFPCEMVEIDGVEVPKGWELSTIGEEVETVGGATPSTKEESFWNNGKISWTTPKDLSSATSPVLINTERKITELGLKKISSGLLPIGTVLLSSRAPVGYLSLAQIPVAINQGYIAIKCNKSLNNYYMLQWCKENLEEIKGRASGTTFLEISKTTFRQIPIIVPDGNILSLFKKQCSSIYQSITVNTKENINLEKTRDLLLPRLLNGES